MKQVNINGLLWDAENLEIEGKKYFTWQEAMEAANSVGKRLPTREEFEALIKTDYEFDEEKKGMWFADNKLFFPLSGCLIYSSGAIQNAAYGFYWSSSPRDASYSWSLYFLSSSAYVGSNNVQYGFPVRCVQDISDNSTSEEEPLHPSKNIDWEQRRYEIARDIYCSMITNKLILNKAAEQAVMYADDLIKQLKKNLVLNGL